eukprot:6481290-Amphidinium_carterae.2
MSAIERAPPNNTPNTLSDPGTPLKNTYADALVSTGSMIKTLFAKSRDKRKKRGRGRDTPPAFPANAGATNSVRLGRATVPHSWLPGRAVFPAG